MHIGEYGPDKWAAGEIKAVKLINVAVNLWFERSVELVIFRRSLVDKRPSEVLNDHEYGRQYINQPITLDITLSIAESIKELGLAPSRIDIGVIATKWLSNNNPGTIDSFVKIELAKIISAGNYILKPKDVVLYGFGRIGRLAAREIITQTGKGEQLRLKAIVVRKGGEKDLLKRASLLRKDSVHGKFKGVVIENEEENYLQINGHKVNVIYANGPDSIDYESHGINDALVIDNTGVWRDTENLLKHTNSKGASKVLLTAPGKDTIPNIVYGVNHKEYAPDDYKVFSAASCTTNAIVPVIDVIKEKYGIDRGHIETVHSYTNDQNLLDNYHKKYRRGRSAPINMVITETGADKAVTKVFPDMAGKLTGNAVRVPTPNVSLAILNLNLTKKAESIEEINGVLRQASSYGKLVEQLDYSTSQELVSTDIIGNAHAGVVDSHATLLSKDGKTAVLYVWYDNEYGYTRQVVRLSKYISKVLRLTYY
jgi:glyceraldehyde 3-phosphate dehydrogenase